MHAGQGPLGLVPGTPPVTLLQTVNRLPPMQRGTPPMIESATV